MKDKKTILVFIDWFLPGYKAGGPIRSVYNIIKMLGERAHFKVITSDRDLDDNEPYEGIETDCWTKYEDIDVYYISRKKLNKKTIFRLLDEELYDTVYLNSFFSKPFSIFPLLYFRKRGRNKEIILAPRGMLGKGALQLKGLKKKIFIMFSKLIGLYKNITWHASTQNEATEIRTIFGLYTPVTVAKNIATLQVNDVEKHKEKGSVNMFFFSRIAEKKNLLFALELLKDVKQGRLNFDIYGPVGEEDYWRKCQKVIKQLPENVKVNYKGPLHPAQVKEELKDQHILFLPTLNENYGHAIVESLAHGCPVLISDRTPWEDLELNSAGLAVPLSDKEKYLDAIEESIAMNQMDFDEWVNGARDYVNNYVMTPSVIAQNKALFLK